MRYAILVLMVGLIVAPASAQDVCPEFKNTISVVSDDGKASQELPIERELSPSRRRKVSNAAPLHKGDFAFSLVGQGSSADVKGTSAGYGSNTQGQTWFGFAVK